MGNRIYSNNDLTHLLDKKINSEEGLEEDLLIFQEDGSRACLNWELRNRADYQLVDFKKEEQFYNKLENMSDSDLLRDAYKQAGINPDF